MTRAGFEPTLLPSRRFTVINRKPYMLTTRPRRKLIYTEHKLYMLPPVITVDSNISRFNVDKMIKIVMNLSPMTSHPSKGPDSKRLYRHFKRSFLRNRVMDDQLVLQLVRYYKLTQMITGDSKNYFIYIQKLLAAIPKLNLIYPGIVLSDIHCFLFHYYLFNDSRAKALESADAAFYHVQNYEHNQWTARVFQIQGHVADITRSANRNNAKKLLDETYRYFEKSVVYDWPDTESLDDIQYIYINNLIKMVHLLLGMPTDVTIDYLYCTNIIQDELCNYQYSQETLESAKSILDLISGSIQLPGRLELKYTIAKVIYYIRRFQTRKYDKQESLVMARDWLRRYSEYSQSHSGVDYQIDDPDIGYELKLYMDKCQTKLLGINYEKRLVKRLKAVQQKSGTVIL